MSIIETANSRGSNGWMERVATAALLLGPVVSVHAQEPSVAVSSGNTSVYLAPNGVTVVDIATPNGAGLSHNYYTHYNVDPTGLVLNNGNTDVVARQSQLAGQITANFNLTKPAGVILNEVVSSNRSNLAGFTEVLGSRADVVLANPYGITCMGCGFINTDRVVLSTGTPYLNATGALGGFSVGRGDILSAGVGLNATGQQVLDLVTRSVRLDAPIHAKDLTITTGANSWDYGTRSVTGLITPNDSAPAYAIDSARLGGMYANNIRLTATEAGVGVRMLGDAAASASDFILTAAGRVELNNKISSHRDVMLSSTSNDMAAISLKDATAAARRNIAVTAELGGLDINTSTLIGGANLKVAGTRIKTGQGSKLQAGGGLSANALTGDLELGTASLRATGDLALRTAGLMNIGGGEGQGVQSTAGNLSVTADGGLLNSGSISADKGMTTLRVNGLLDTSGLIHAGLALDIADASGGGSQTLNNSGALIAGQSMNILSYDVTNEKGAQVQANTGSRIAAANLSNAGTWLLSQQVATRDHISVGSVLSNSGIMQSAGSANYDAAKIDNSSTMLAGEQLTVNVADGLANYGGAVLQAGQQLSINGNGASLTNDKEARILGDGLSLSVGSLDNAGAIQGGGRRDTAVNVKTTLSNQASGLLNLATTAGGAGMLSAETLANLGTMQSAGAMTVNVGTGGLNNTGSMIAQGDLSLQSRSVGGDYNAFIGGQLQSGREMSISGGSATTLDIASKGVVLGNRLQGTLGTVHLSDGAKLSSADDMTLSLGALLLDGSRSAVLGSTDGSGFTSLTTNSGITNNGILFSGHDLTVNTPWLINAMTGGIVALRNLSVSANNGNLMNLGALYAGKVLKAIADAGTLTNVASLSAYQGTIDSDGSITLRAKTLINNSTIQGKGDILIDAETLRNEFVGGDTRQWGVAGPKTTVQTGRLRKGYNEGCCDQTEAWYYADTWSQEQYYAGGAPDLNFRPKIVGDSTVNLRFQTGTNLGGVLSGSTMNLIGKSNTSMFSNNDYSLLRLDYRDDYAHYIKYIAAGPAKYVNDRHHNSSVRVTPSTLSQVGANIYATTLNAGGFALANSGSPWGTVPVSSVSTMPKASPTSSANAVPLITKVSPLVLGGLTITLPVNPNGYYVTALEPGARYLVETNPLYRVGSTAVGSDYLANRLGYDPSMLERRLGDASYEAYLIKQQLVEQTGKSLLNSVVSDSEQVKKLMDQAADESQILGLVYGEPLTQKQQDNLQHDIVWMVQTEVHGQKVLAPVVYLGKNTKSNVIQDAGISAETAWLNLTSLTNTGGTISGSKSLVVTSSGDITNTSGTIQGGNMTLKSAGGKVVNQTIVHGSGNDKYYTTTIGKAASIQSTGTLSIEADKDITIIGASVSSGGDASLHAGKNVTFDTLQSTDIATTHEQLSENGGSGQKTTTTTQLKQIKSGLAIGGDLSMGAGNDITFAGTDVKTAGNASLEAGKDINIIARENTTTTHSESKISGFGMNSSLFASKETTVDSTSVRNVGSTFNINGDVALIAKGDVAVQGSNLDVAGKGLIEATNLKVLAGKNYDESHTTIKTTNVLSVSRTEPTPVTNDSKAEAGKVGARAQVRDFNNRGSAEAEASAQSSTSAKNKDGAVAASAKGNAEAKATAKGSLSLLSTTITQTNTSELTHIGSQLKFGGNADIITQKDVTLDGSRIEAGGDTNVKARNVNLIAAEDKKASDTTVTSLSVGLLLSSDNKASASAPAEVNAAGKNSTPNANASSQATAGARSYNELNFMESSKESQSTLDTKHQGASIHAGGNLSIKANDTLTVTGSSLAAGKDLNLDAKDQHFNAVNDVHEVSKSSDRTSIGLFLDAKANASAEAKAGVALGANAKARAAAGASVDFGVHGTNAKNNSLEGSTTAQVSSIKAGGNINRTATNNISDVGTAIEASSDLNQSAKTITSRAARNSTYSNSSSEKTDARVGVFAGAFASASLWNTENGGSDPTDQGGWAGIRGGASHNRERSDSYKATAVVSSIKVGRNVTSHSLGTTSLEGTKISAGQDVALGAKTLGVSTARNSDISTRSNVQGGGVITADLVNKSGRVEMSAGGGNSSDNSNKAVVASIQAGNNLAINTGGDTHLEGAKLTAGNIAEITTGGKLNFKEAKNSSHSNSNGGEGWLLLGASKSSQRMNTSGKYDHADSRSYTAMVGGITSGGALNIRSGGDATFIGTALQSGGAATVTTGGDLNFKAAHSTENSTAGGFNLTLLGKVTSSKEEEETVVKTNGYTDIGVNFNKKDIDKASVATINSRGGIQLSSGGNTTLEGTRAKTDGSITIDAGGRVRKQVVTDIERGGGFNLSLTGQTAKESGSVSSSTSESKEGDSAASSSTSRSRTMGLISGTGFYKTNKHITTLEGAQGVTINQGVKSGKDTESKLQVNTQQEIPTQE